MPSANPCLGCGFELDADGYLVRVGEIEKESILTEGFAPPGSFHYCDPTDQRSWDVPWVLPWGLYDEAVQTINTVIPVGATPTGFWQMPGLGPFGPATSLYAPFRRVRLEGWIEVAVPAGAGLALNVAANGVSPPNLSDQLADQASFGMSVPISVGISGPSIGPWVSWWTVADAYSGQYVQFRLGANSSVSACTVTKVALSLIDDGPARGVFYTSAQRFWPSPLPYP
jgi:hypothetical protein